MRSMEEFNALTELEQAEAIWDGNFLGSFHGEVFYDAHTNKILRLRAFDATSQLVPYLAHIRFNLH